MHLALAALMASTLTLTLWEEEQPDIQAALDDAIQHFEAEQKDVRVKRSHYKTEDLRVQFQTAGIAGKGADLLLAPNDFAGVLSTMGLIQPVDGLTDMRRFTEANRAAITDAQGRSWGVPVNRGNHLVLFVNKRLAGKVPATLEELRDVAERATDRARGRYGFAHNATEPFWFVPFISAFGERPLVNGRPNLANAATEQALAYVRGLEMDAHATPTDCDYACAETLFLERKAAMTINGDWAIGKYAAALKDDLAIAPLPRSAATGKWSEPMVSGKYLLFNAKLKGERLAAAKRFADYMTSPATQERLALRSKRLPSVQAVADAKAVRADPLLAASEAALAHAQPMPMAVEMRAVWDAIRPQLQEIMAGRSDPKRAAAAMQKDAEAKIRDMTH